MNAHAMNEDREMCLSAGMDRYVTKPFQYNELTSVLQSLFGGRPARYATGSPADDPGPPADLSLQPAGVKDIISHFQKGTNFTDDQIAKLIAASRLSIRDNLEKASTAFGDKDYPSPPWPGPPTPSREPSCSAA